MVLDPLRLMVMLLVSAAPLMSAIHRTCLSTPAGRLTVTAPALLMRRMASEVAPVTVAVVPMRTFRSWDPPATEAFCSAMR